MKKHTMTVAAMAVASLAWIPIAVAQGPGGHMRRPGGTPYAGRVAERLELTDEQKAQWKTIHEKAREDGDSLMKAAAEARKAFDTALNAETANAAAVGEAALAMKTARDRVSDHRQQTQEAIKAILTPEQLAKFEEMEKRMRGHREDGPQGQGARKRPSPEGAK